MNFLRQSTAVDIAIGPFLDATDGVTAETGLTISQADVRLKKNNGNWAQVNDNTSATHEENGWYEKELDATDTNTVGILIIAVHESGALPVWHEFTVLEEAVYDALFAASAPGYVANAPVNVAQFGGSNGTFSSGRPEVNAVGDFTATMKTSLNAATPASVVGAVGSVTGNVGGNVAGSVASVTAGVTVTTNNDKTGYVLTAGERTSVADALLNRDMSTGTDSGSETVRTVRQALRFLRNKWTIADGTLTVNKEDDTTASWTAAVTQTAGNPVSEVDPASS